MAQELKTFEDAENYAETAIASLGGVQAAEAPDLGTVCRYWNLAKPLVEMIFRLPIIPQRFRRVIQPLVDTLNSLCPE